ncbi:uridine kinase [Marinomonas foliarum]|uniref:Uridine kinase n=1 Tax=Marinomonas foliarum TaxID=491950 RepID=A0ABX7IPF1_9GAMM|nr:uridine kinase [Marinomonas foliarum]QRV22817.1 uridine kinase [Marinomonas foliarum]
MSRKVAPVLLVFALVLLVSRPASVMAETNESIALSDAAELFGLPVKGLALSQLESRLESMGLQSYPSYKLGVVSYSLGPEGILGVTNATIHFNSSKYVRQVLLSGVVESNEKRKNLGELLGRKYGPPSEGFLNGGLGRSKWSFRDGTTIDFRNTTYDVSVLYVDEQPKVISRSGKIDVEALSNKK